MKTILYDKNPQGYVTITLNRPQVRNALNDKMIKELTDAFSLAIVDPDVRSIVLTGSAPLFCSGADLEWMKRLATYSLEENKEDALQLAELMETIYICPKPTIVCVQGGAFGGALGLISACDIAIADDKSLYCLSEVRLGLIPAVISPYVQRAMGARQTKKLTLTGEKFSAAQAHQWGLIHYVVTAEKIEEICQHVLDNLLKGGPSAQAIAKELLEHGYDPIGDDLNNLTSHYIAEARASAEGREGMQAFLEKRPPSWMSPKNDIQNEDQ